MIVVERIADLREHVRGRASCRADRRARADDGLLPRGSSLARCARPRAATTSSSRRSSSTRCSSAPNEDLAAYPRDLAGDIAAAEAEGVDVLFAPSVAEMYPEPARHDRARRRAHRGLVRRRRGPTHFDGVTTVVAKLFSIVGPCTRVLRAQGLPAARGRAPHGRRSRPPGRQSSAARWCASPTVSRCRAATPTSRPTSASGAIGHLHVAASAPPAPSSRANATRTRFAQLVEHGGRRAAGSSSSTSRFDGAVRSRAARPARRRGRRRGGGAGRHDAPHRQRHHADHRRRGHGRPRRHHTPNREHQLMHRTMMKSKIHRATVTGADLNYIGSITLDPVLMELRRPDRARAGPRARHRQRRPVRDLRDPGRPRRRDPQRRRRPLVHTGDRVIVISLRAVRRGRARDVRAQGRARRLA